MKIAFLDHSFHKKTKSFDFLRNIIKEKHKTIDFWDENWEGGQEINIDNLNKENFDVIIFFQIILRPSQIKKIECKNLIWVPMYDTEIIRRLPILSGFLYFNIKILSFSKALTNKFKKIGYDILTVQYYPKPSFQNIKNEKLSVLFWQRTTKINWGLVKKLINGSNIKEIFYKNNPDPLFKIKGPELEDIDKFNITQINGWLKYDEYLQLLNKSNIYIAPRVYEGIGMSFLDAMATGSVIIAPNKPTMNEYIEDGVTGYLYDINNPKKINLENIKTIQKNSKEKIENGYRIWKEQEKDILEFIITPIKYKNKNYFAYFICYIITEIVVNIKKIIKFIIWKK